MENCFYLTLELFKLLFLFLTKVTSKLDNPLFKILKILFIFFIISLVESIKIISLKK